MSEYPDPFDDTYPRNSYGDDGKDGEVLDMNHIHRETAWSDHPYLNGGIFQAIIDRYWAKGEHGVIYTDMRSPYRVIKVANLDITDSEHNWQMAEFLEENWKRDIEGLVKIYTYWSGTCDGFHYQLIDKVKKTSTPFKVNQVIATLDLEKGDEVMFAHMEMLPYVGLNHPDLTMGEMIKRVASAAENITIKTGEVIHDLRQDNYGFRKDGTAAFFDFNIGDVESSFTNYYFKRREDESLWDYYYRVIRVNADYDEAMEDTKV
tara:strand:+ start:2870 stop:3655 length:786 start_codon:yes stop_codon:yes gene_type:complete